jgi:hypothetical protein
MSCLITSVYFLVNLGRKRNGMTLFSRVNWASFSRPLFGKFLSDHVVHNRTKCCHLLSVPRTNHFTWPSNTGGDIFNDLKARLFLLTVILTSLKGQVSAIESKVLLAWFQASAAMLVGYSFFWGITQRRVVIFYLRFWKTRRLHRSLLDLDFLNLEYGTDWMSRNVG